ncbi:MAG: thioesterase family protein [Candidatus Bathyarchaeia archaeon]|jgi:YbgC/YbaW family acyl-CoA thioester hydrolase
MPTNSFKTTLRVTWADTDAAQVVHFSKFFVYFERAEEEFYRSLGFNFTDLRNKGFWLPRVEAFCQYRKPARFDDMLEVELTVEELREKSVKLGFNIAKKETAELLTTGYLVVVAADRNTGKAAQIPKEIGDKLKPFSKQIL